MKPKARPKSELDEEFREDNVFFDNESITSLTFLIEWDFVGCNFSVKYSPNKELIIMTFPVERTNLHTINKNYIFTLKSIYLKKILIVICHCD